LAYFVISL